MTRSAKLRILVAVLLALAASVRANLTTTINVTTTTDEDGTNPGACSLREAVTAVNTLHSWGGCPAGEAFNNNVIQLKPGDYSLNSVLVIDRDVEISGSDRDKATHDEETDPITGQKPRRVRPDYVDASGNPTGTFIHAPVSQRIFYANAGVTLKDLGLQGNGAVSGNGGLIYANKSLSLTNVIMMDGVVTGAIGELDKGYGGAIYLAGGDTSLNFTETTLQDNSAFNSGGAVAMLCSKDLGTYVGHKVGVIRSLFKDNSSTNGAGAIDICGDTNVTLAATTFSHNISASNSGTLSYLFGSSSAYQHDQVARGQLSLSYVTAAEQEGHFIALNGLASVSIASSLLGRFSNRPLSTELCYNPTAVPTVPVSFTPTGTFNALGDGTCDGVIAAASPKNFHYDASITPIGNVLNVPIASAVYPYVPNGPFGLTEYYLPASGSLLVDAGDDLENCTEPDQRGAARNSGTACDIGAVERLQVTARDDSADSQVNTDRQAIVDVLANDSFGEDDNNGPYKFAANDDDANASVKVQSVSDPDDVDCKWMLSTDADHPNRLIVSRKNGVLTDVDSPISCTYKVVDTNPVVANAVSATTATVTVQIKNAAPVAKPDNYLRPVGVAEISFDPLENDNDDGDGKYGHKPKKDENGNVVMVDGSGNPVSENGYIVFTDQPDWAEPYPIEIVSQPELGEVFGAASGICPGTEANPATCYKPPLHYIARNNLAPFADSFTYKVYDSDGQASHATTVTIVTDAPDLDHGGGAGSFDLLSGLALSLLGLRRLRKL